jgi:hypothetical protein
LGIYFTREAVISESKAGIHCRIEDVVIELHWIAHTIQSARLVDAKKHLELRLLADAVASFNTRLFEIVKS